MQLPTPDDAFDIDFMSHIDDPGWGVIVVPEDEDGPGFAFSVGLYHSHRHPELIVLGLPDAVATDIINLAGDMIAEGQRFADGARTDALVDGFSCLLKPVAEQHHEAYLGYATWFYQALDHAVPYLQVAWPDADGKLPDDEAFDAELRAVQPSLWSG